MNSCDKLLSSKKSDSLVILGCGYSINKISEGLWEKIGQVDSIGFNWFCKSGFVPTHYLIREQANNSPRQTRDENPNLLIKTLSGEKYNKTFFVILDIRNHSKNAFDYTDKFIKENKAVLVDRKKKLSKIEYLKKNVCDFGVFHGRCTLVSVLHLAIFLKYKRIYFAGVDLKDSRYFWLQKNETRHTIKKKGKTFSSIHPIAGYTARFIKRMMRSFPEIEFYIVNKKSMLRDIIHFGIPG